MSLSTGFSASAPDTLNDPMQIPDGSFSLATNGSELSAVANVSEPMDIGDTVPILAVSIPPHRHPIVSVICSSLLHPTIETRSVLVARE